MIKQVFYLGNPYRPNQVVNIERIRLLFDPLFFHLGIDTNTIISDVNLKQTDEDSIFLNSLINYPKPFVGDFEFDNSAVVGFEVPIEEIKVLNKKSIPWINLKIHPLRFLDDINFSISASFDFNLNKMSTQRGAIKFRAEQIKSRYCSDSQKGQSNKTLMLVEQVADDKNVFFGNCFRNLEDYFEEIKQITSSYKRVLFKAHPWQKPMSQDFFVKNLNAEPVSDMNIYASLIKNKVDAVCGISSSVLYEAKWFDIEAIFLENPPRYYGEPISYKRLVDNLDFWECGLLRREKISQSSGIASEVPKDYLRSIFGGWGYISEQDDIQKKLLEIEAKAEEARIKAEEARIKAEEARIKAETSSSKYLPKIYDIYNRYSSRMTRLLNRFSEFFKSIWS